MTAKRIFKSMNINSQNHHKLTSFRDSFTVESCGKVLLNQHYESTLDLYGL